MALKHLTCLLAFCLTAADLVNGQGCSWNVHKDIPTGNNVPVMFTYDGKNLEYAVPNPDGNIELAKDQELVVSCPGNGNSIGAVDEQTSNAKCENGKTLLLNGGEFELKDLTCTKKAWTSAVNTKKPCANGNGVTVEIGYNADGIGWQKMIESCHNLEGSFTYYSKHTLFGSAIANRVSHGRPKFVSGGSEFYKGIDVNKAYTENHQESLIEEMVGSQNLDQFFNPHQNLYMARGHLAPNGDFLFGAYQALSFFYLNAAPQWQVINGGNWEKVESNARDFAEQNSMDLEVVTGTLGVMKVMDQEMYLAGDNRLPSPEYYWKILRNPSDDSCIAFVSTNDPFLKSPPRPLCSNICSESGWPEFSDLRAGYVYCCDYNGIKSAIKHVPDMNCGSVLQYN